MAKSIERLRAIELRRKGESIKEIAKDLSVSPSSVLNWTRDITLTPSQREKLHMRWVSSGLKGRMMGAQANRAKRQFSIDSAAHEAAQKIKSLTRSELFFVGLGLYWGEGNKATNASVAIVNSDPLIIQLMMRWFNECWDIDVSRFQPRVFISDTHRDREELITKFWMKTLSLPRKQFRRMIFLDRGKKIYENRDVYYGVLTLRVSRGAELRHRILASIRQTAKVGIMPV